MERCVAITMKGMMRTKFFIPEGCYVNTGGIGFPKQQGIIVERCVAITIERDDAN